MEIIKGIKPDNEIEYIEELNIPKIEKDPLSMEYVDTYSILVPKNLRVQNNNKICIIQERDEIQLLSLEKEKNNIEYIDEILIEGYIKQDNEIQLIDQMEILKQIKPENEIQYNDEFVILKKEKEPLSIEYLDYLSIIIYHL